MAKFKFNLNQCFITFYGFAMAGIKSTQLSRSTNLNKMHDTKNTTVNPAIRKADVSCSFVSPSTSPNELFVCKVKERIEFWESQDRSEKEKLKGLACSILSLIDNVSDIEDCKLIVNGKNVSGNLHELLFA